MRLALGLVALVLVLAPSRAHAQAEPAPESYVPPNRPGVPQPTPPEPHLGPLPKWHLGVAPHLAVRLGDAPAGVPVPGFGAGVQVARALLPLGRGRFGVAADFAYDRLQHDKKTGMFSTGTQVLAHATFAAMAVVDGIVGRFRPWLGVGGGFSIGNYEDPPSTDDPKGVSDVGAAGLVKLALGVGVAVYDGVDLGLRGDFDFTFSSETAGTPPKSVFSPGLFTLGLELGFRI